MKRASRTRFARAMRKVANSINNYDCTGMHDALDNAQDHASTPKHRNAIFKALQKISRICAR